MTDMSTGKHIVFGSGFMPSVIMLAMLLATFAAFAQEELDEVGPAVDTSAIEAESAASDRSEVDDIGPAVDTSAMSDDITRRTTGSGVMDSIELGRTEITGNQELPKVLYIVPWKKADPEDLMGKPINSLLDEVLAPLDRDEFIRQVDYYDDLYGKDAQE
jgi:hypothetical protein